MPNPNDRMMPAWDDVLADQQAAYEEAVVKYVLRHTGLRSLEEDFRVEQTTAADTQLTFYRFATASRFPLWLEANKLRYLHQDEGLVTNLADAMYHRLTRTPVWRAFIETPPDIPPEYSSLPYGVVFAWPGRSKFTVFHNRVGPPCGRGQFFHTDKEGASGGPYWCQDLADLLQDLGEPAGW